VPGVAGERDANRAAQRLAGPFSPADGLSDVAGVLQRRPRMEMTEMLERLFDSPTPMRDTAIFLLKHGEAPSDILEIFAAWSGSPRFRRCVGWLAARPADEEIELPYRWALS
jgi:hypothetical protein